MPKAEPASEINQKRQRRIDQMPKSLHANYEKAQTSKAAAIKAMCAECCGYDRKTVRLCTDYGCPLWPHRPYQKKTDEEDEG